MNSIRLEGDTRKLISKLRSISDIDTKGINRAVAESLRTSTLDRFREQEEPSGKKWTNSIRASESGGVTLVKNAMLRNSIKSQANKSGAAVGTNTIYARTHQFGDKRTIKAKNRKGLRFQFNGKWVTKKSVKINIPARPFLGINEEDQREIRGIIEDAIKD